MFITNAIDLSSANAASNSGEKANQKELLESLNTIAHPFDHDLNLLYSEGESDSYMVCCHPFSSNAQKILDEVRLNCEDHLISFNTRDHGFTHETGDDNQTVMATPIEIMPLLFTLKTSVCDVGLKSLSLYGKGLGASNIIHALSFLQTNTQDALLLQYGISEKEKREILQALEKGKIILESPFKSIEETIDLKGPNPILLMYQKRAQDWGLLSPLLALKTMSDLGLDILLGFMKDSEFFNRDDELFYQNLCEANQNGETRLIKDDDEGKDAFRSKIWSSYLDWK